MWCLRLLVCLAIAISPGIGLAGSYRCGYVADTLIASGDSEVEWVVTGATLDYQAIGEWPYDTLTSYVSISGLDEQMYELFTFDDPPFPGYGGFDSLRIQVTGRKSGGAGSAAFSFALKTGGTYYEFDTTAALSTTWTQYTGTYDISGWTTATFNASTWGFYPADLPTSTYRIQISNLRMIVYYRQLQIVDTIKTSTYLADTWIDGADPNANYGDDTDLVVGNRATGLEIGRALFYPRKSILQTWEWESSSRWQLDTATLSVNAWYVAASPAHDIFAYVTHANSLPGHGNASIDSPSVTWDDRFFSLGSGYAWQKAGADSTDEYDGTDRETAYLDSQRVTTTGWINFNVVDWLRQASGAAHLNAYDSVWHPRALMLKQSSEATADSSIRLYAMNSGGAANRPYVRCVLHYTGPASDIDTSGGPGEPGGFGPPGAANYQVIATAGTSDHGGRFEIATIADTTGGDINLKVRYKDNLMAAGNLGSGSCYNATATSKYVLNEASYWGCVQRIPRIFDSLDNYCIGDAVTDTGYIDSVIWRLYVNSENVDATTYQLYLKVRGPILQYWRPAATTYATFTDVAGVMDARNARTSATDSLRWNSATTYLPIGRTAGVTGEVIADYNVSASNISTYDVSYEDSVYVVAHNWVAGWQSVNITKMFKDALCAYVNEGAGGSYLDTAGFSWMAQFSKNGNTETWFHTGATARGMDWRGVYTDTVYAERFYVYTDAALETYCAAAGQVIIIGQRDEELGPPRNAYRRFCPE